MQRKGGADSGGERTVGGASGNRVVGFEDAEEGRRADSGGGARRMHLLREGSPGLGCIALGCPGLGCIALGCPGLGCIDVIERSGCGGARSAEGNERDGEQF